MNISLKFLQLKISTVGSLDKKKLKLDNSENMLVCQKAYLSTQWKYMKGIYFWNLKKNIDREGILIVSTATPQQ